MTVLLWYVLLHGNYGNYDKVHCIAGINVDSVKC